MEKRRNLALFNNLRLGIKLAIGYGLMLGLLLAVMAGNILIDQFVSQPARDSLKVSQHEAALAEQLGREMSKAHHIVDVMRVQMMAGEYVPLEENEDVTAGLEHMTNALSIIDELRLGTQGETRNADNVQQLDEIATGVSTYRDAIYELLTVVMPERGQGESGLSGDLVDKVRALDEQVPGTEIYTVGSAYAHLRTDEYENYLLAFQKEIAALKNAIQTSVRTPSEKEKLLAQVDEAQTAFQALLMFDTQQLLVKANLIMEIGPQIAEMVETFVEQEREQQTEAQERLEYAGRLQTTYNPIVLVVALVVGAGLTIILTINIRRPVVDLTQTARQIAEGDYQRRVNVTTTDEVGQLAQSFNTMVEAIASRETELREQTHKLRIATAQASEAARLKSEFLANMSHELRTPLNAIIGFSDMLLMGIGGGLDEKQRHKVERLRDNGTRLLNLVNDILDLTRIEARRIEIAQKPFSPATLLERLAKQMEPLAEKKQLAFQTIVDPHLPASLIGDEQRIEQIVVNLLSNAVKFTDTGSVTLEARADYAAEEWCIAVTDTGIGIPPHARTVIFEEFRQLDGSSTRAYQGSGLGLAITHNLVRMMSGHIDLQSEQGTGSTFTVSLPLIENMGSDESAPESVSLPEAIGS